MRLTFKQIDNLRIKSKIKKLVHIKTLLLDISKEVNEAKLIELWGSYLKHNHNSNPYLNLYVNSPFCLDKKCSYCHYKSEILKDFSDLDNYLDKIEVQAKKFSKLFKNFRFAGLYLGGGTASIYNFGQLKRLYGLIFDNFSFSKNAELNQEFSFRTMTEEKLQLCLKYGFNRLTFGLQSFDPEVLKLAKREYPDIEKIKRFVNIINNTPTRLVSGDILRFLPGDTIDKLYKSIKQAIDLGLPQIFIYYFHSNDELKIRNKNNFPYYNYKKPYSDKEVKSLFKKMELEYPAY